MGAEIRKFGIPDGVKIFNIFKINRDSQIAEFRNFLFHYDGTKTTFAITGYQCVSTGHVVEMYIYNLEFIMSKFDLNLNYYCILPILNLNINLTISKIMPKTLHRLFVCVYTNKYNILCRFYVILFVHFYIKKYNSVPLYFISFFNFDILLNFDAI